MKRDCSDLSPNPRDGASLTSLCDDTLMAVLLRTLASDHANLRLSCKRIRDMIDSVQFRKERSVQGFAEVRVELLSPFEQYQLKRNYFGEGPLSEQDDDFHNHYDKLGFIEEFKDHSFETNCFRVFVDGRPIHKVKDNEEKNGSNGFKVHIRLLPLKTGFWSMCDCYSQELCDLATLLFTDKGIPKVDSLKRALTGDHYAAKKMLYIEDFEVPFEYRLPLSIVGPLIIKRMLLLFKKEFSIAMCIPFRKAQFTEQDIEDAKRWDRFFGDEMEVKPQTEEDRQAEHEWVNQNDVLQEQDIRQFFRAGFHQVDDRSIVEATDYSFLFAIPDDVDRPMLSVEETLTQPIARKAPTRPEAKGLAGELRLVVESKTQDWMRIMDESRSRDEMCSRIQAVMGTSVGRVESELESLKAQLREQVKIIIDKSERPLQLILDSDVVHVTTAANSMDLLEILLEFLPASDKTKAVNGLDRFGDTPLMVIAGVAPTLPLQKCRKTMETLIEMGANKNLVNASQGLSALGYFRDSKRKAEVPRMIFGFAGPSAEAQAEVSRIEALLRPVNGPTPADNAAIETIDDSPQDEFDY